MEEQKKPKLGAVVILDKEILSYDVLRGKKFETKVTEPFNNLSIDFLVDFSSKLRKFKKINSFPDLIYLIFWCSENKNKNLAYKLSIIFKKKIILKRTPLAEGGTKVRVPNINKIKKLGFKSKFYLDKGLRETLGL